MVILSKISCEKLMAFVAKLKGDNTGVIRFQTGGNFVPALCAFEPFSDHSGGAEICSRANICFSRKLLEP